MMIALHKNSHTSPAIRAAIQGGADSIVAPAQCYGISEETARKWNKRSWPKTFLRPTCTCRRNSLVHSRRV